MPALVAFVRLEEECLLGGTILLVLYQLLTGKINTRGLLDDKLAGRRLTPERLQLLVLTVGAATYYLLQVIGHPTYLPSLPQELLLALGGSNALYLGAKTFSLFSPTGAAPEADNQAKGG